MSDKDEHKQPNIEITETQDPTFVNEECGDTMWDVVLKEAEERLHQIATKSEDKFSPKNMVQDNHQ